MEIDKTKQQKKLERFFMMPNMTPVLGVTIRKDTDIEDEDEVKDEVSRKTIKQKIKGTHFITETTLETTLENGEKMKESSILEVDLNEGERLIYLPGKGYILAQEPFATIDEIVENYNYLKE